MDYLAKIKEKDLEFTELDQRMQTDVDLLYLKKYVMTDKTGKHAVPDIINSTLNKPAVFAANVNSALGAVKQQVVVESDSKKIDTHEIEEFQDAAFGMANARLRKLRYPLLNPFADAQLCIRGRTGRRVLFRMENDELVPDITPWDGRYIRYEVDDDGLAWASVTTMRTRGQIEADYGIPIKGTTAQVRDVWDREHNEVWVEEREVISQPHPYGLTPVVLSIVSLGYGDILLDLNRLKYEGESIFFLIRDVVPQLNMLLSILQTLNFLSVKRPEQYESKEGPQATPPEYEEAIRPGAMTAVDIGGGIKPIDFGDATRAAQMAYEMIEKAVQEGGYTDIDIGNVRQPFSAIALITIGESKDQVYLPRLAAKEWLNIDTAEMFTRQVIQIGGSVELGTPGHKRKFNTSKLEGEYTTDYKYFVKSPKIDIARMAVAQQAKEWYPRRYIYEEVLQVEDPKGLEDEWYSELAEKIDPNVLKHRIIMNLLDLAEEGDENAAREAKIMAAGMGLTIAQVKAGITPKPPELPEPEKETVPLLGEGGQTGGIIPSPARRASELMRTPQMAGTAQ